MNCKIIFSLLFVQFFQLYTKGQSTGHGGTRYVVMFPDGNSPVTRAELLISTLQDTEVRLTSGFPGIDRVLQVRANEGAVVSLPPEIVLNGNKREDKGIIIESDLPIYVYGHSGDDCCAGEGFQAIPVDFWGKEYYTATQYNSTVAVVATEADTEVSVTKGFWGGVTFESVYYGMGENITFNLTAGQTAQLQTPSGYLLGTRVYSNKPVGVISGQYYASPSSRRAKFNQMIEFIPPSSSLGTDFITPPVFNSTYINIYYNNLGADNVISTKGKNVNLSSNLQRRGGSRITAGAANPYHGSSTEPVIVTASPLTISPFMLFIPSLDQYSNNYKFLTPTKANLTHYIVIIVKSQDENGIRLDGNKIYSKIEGVDVLLINDVIYLIISAEVSAGQHQVTHQDPNVKFGLILYGFDDTQSYAYPAGLSLPSASSPAAGMPL